MKTLCVSLDTAKALKAAGWTKPTHFQWLIKNNGSQPDQIVDFHTDHHSENHYTYFPCPTAEEVLRELPEKIDLNEWRRDLQFIFISPEKGKWEVSYGQFKKFKNKSLSEAAAQIWLWCVEQGHIKTEAKP